MHLTAPTLNWKENATPCSEEYGDVYFSVQDGLAEARHVFLSGNFLPERWQHLSITPHLLQGMEQNQMPQQVRHDKVLFPFTIAETGFGTGLNFLALWQMWQTSPAPRPRLHYITTELHPLPPEALHQAHQRWPELAELSKELLRIYPPTIPGAHRRWLAGGQIQIDFLWGDAAEMLARYQPAEGILPQVDAWFLDGFVPAKNPMMWQPALYQAMARLSGEGTTLATFTVAGDVRRGLQEAVFTVEKAKGFGRKREMLVGCYTHKKPLSQNPVFSASNASEQNNDISGSGAQQRQSKPIQRPHTGYQIAPFVNHAKGVDSRASGMTAIKVDKAVVIGAGIAGILSAWRMAQQGVQVTLLESGVDICGGASGNPASAFTPFHTTEWTPRSQQIAGGFSTMQHILTLLHTKGHVIQGDTDGLLMLDMSHFNRRSARMVLTQRDLTLPPEIRREVTAQEASDIAGIPLRYGGWHYTQGGWFNMRSLCTALLADAGERITLHTGITIERLEHIAGQWQAVSTQGEIFHSACIVLAAGEAAARLMPELKLEPVHGQLLTFAMPLPPRCMIHAGHTLIPLGNGRMSWGSTYRHHIAVPDILPEETANLQQEWQQAFPDIPITSDVASWAGLRCTHPSRMPLIGQMQGKPEGLYLNLAHGSRGTITSAVAFANQSF